MICSSGMPSASRYLIRISKLRDAARLFPLDRFLREQPARAAMVFHKMLPRQAVLVLIDEALARDPWAWDLRYNRAVLTEREP